MKGQDDLISVIMGVYNEKDEGTLDASISSILNQTYKKLEFIIWDDGSDIDGIDVLKKVIAWDDLHEVSRRDERIRLIVPYEHKGLAHSLNGCIAHARGLYIARMDADDISDIDRLSRQQSFLSQCPEYSWCGTNTVLYDEEGTFGERKMPEIPSANDFLKYSPYIHPTVMFRKSVFEENEGYSEEREMLRCEDLELFTRLTAKGLKGYNIQENLFFYKEDRDSFKRRTFQNRINESKLRMERYKELGILKPGTYICAIRPVLAGMLPSGMIRQIKRREGKKTRKQHGGRDIS